MEQIETQVSDLRYLTQANVPLPAERAAAAYSESPHQQTALSPLSATAGDNSAYQPGAARHAHEAYGAKRKSEDEGSVSKQQRSKRNRYISIACNECKRRKIKCNGETPCQRCGNLNLNCLYAPNCCSNSFKDSEEFRRMADHMARMQEQVDSLYQNMSTLRSEALRLAPIQDKAAFRGPTSTAFSLDVANNTIHNMGYKGIGDAEDQASPTPDEGSVRAIPSEFSPDPLWEFDKDEMIRLCRLHEEEVGIMYPVLQIQTVINHAKTLSAYMDSTRKQGMARSLNDEKTLQLKMVMCCALAVEEHGHSEKAIRLYDSMEAIVNRKLMADASSFANLPLLALLAGYRFLSNDEILAWRVMGQVARLCLELGIHRRSGIMKIQDDQERKNALNSFWSAYVLDRRWAFNTGLPYVVQDQEVDPDLPMPDEYPYLVAMITYSRLGAKVWRHVAHFGPVLAREVRHEDIQLLDQEILQWYESVPEEVKLRNWDKEQQMTFTPSYNLQRLRIWTYLRLNQIRIWLYTPILHSATSIMNNFAQAQRVVDLAKDTIRYLTHLNSTTNLYRKIQVFYHQFLTSAIAVVFLASVHAPVRFSSSCRDEFYMGLELVKDLSAKSWVSTRLWRTIGSLKEVAPSIGLRQQQDDDPHSSAAIAMAGLASGRLPNNPAPISPFGRPSVSTSTSIQPPLQQTTPGMESSGSSVASPNNGARIQTEMSRIFEGYVGMGGFPPGMVEDMNGLPSAGLPTPDSAGMHGIRGNDGTVFHHFQEMY